jgi:hypothetical protein
VKKNTAILFLLVLVAAVWFALRMQNKEKPGRDETRKEQKKPGANDPSARRDRRDEGFNRNTTNIIYTKHARCRMGCRHIDESEVMEILENGEINYNKSDLRASPDPKYALEGTTHDGQQVRIIFAPSPRGMVVITVIDLDTGWHCNCN